MIYGVGADIVELSRIELLLARFGDRLARRILAESELPDFAASPTASLLAKRFAAKEALAKALGTGLRYPVTLTRISVVRDELGKPSFSFDRELARFVENRGILNHHLSISDERSMACAFVVLERK